MANEVEIIVRGKDHTQAAFTSASRGVKNLHDNVDRLGSGFSGVFGKKIADTVSNGVGNLVNTAQNLFSTLFDSASKGAATMATNVASGFASAAISGTAMTAATGGLNIVLGILVAALVAVYGALAMAATGFLALAPAVLIAGGAMGAAATAAVGLVGAFGVMKMGLGGLGEAWSSYGRAAGGGGGAASGAAKQVAAAQREVKSATEALTEAQRAAQQAQEAVTRARAAETERLEDLNRSLNGARLDEKGAALGVERASLNLEEARQSEKDALLDVAEAEKKLADARWAAGLVNADQRQSVLDIARAEQELSDARRNADQVPLKIKEAELAYKQAQQAVANAKDAVEDLTEEQVKSKKVGVEGSDQVRQALERQRQATMNVTKAQERLKLALDSVHDAAAGAGGGGGGGGINQFNEAMKKLSPNAQKLIRALIELKPAFDNLKKSVQDRLLAGFDVAIKDLAHKWLPALKPMLGELADSFNRIGINMMKALGNKEFIEDIKTAMGGFGNMIDRIGQSIPRLIGAFGDLAAGSTPFLEKIGDIIGDIIDGFAKWIDKAEKSGALKSFMEDAAKALQDIWDITKLVIKIAKDLIEILFPSSKKDANSFLGGIKEMLTNLEKWLSDEKNKKKIQEWIDKIHDFAGKLINEVIPNIIKTVNTITYWVDKFDSWGKTIGKWKDTVVRAVDAVTVTFGELKSAATKTKDWIVARFNDVINNLTGLPKRASNAFSGMFDGVKVAFKSAMNWVIDRWNDFSIPGINTMFGTIGGFTTPNIGRFAHGGIAGGLIEVGERGRELIRVPNGSTVIPNGTTEAMLAKGQSGTVTVNIYAQGSILGERDIVRIIRDEFINGGFRGVVKA